MFFFIVEILPEHISVECVEQSPSRLRLLLVCFLPGRHPVTLRGQQPYKHDCCCTVSVSVAFAMRVSLCFIRDLRTWQEIWATLRKIHLRNYFTLTFAVRRVALRCPSPLPLVPVLFLGIFCVLWQKSFAGRRNEIAPGLDSSVLLLLNYYTALPIALLEIFFRSRLGN